MPDIALKLWNKQVTALETTDEWKTVSYVDFAALQTGLGAETPNGWVPVLMTTRKPAVGDEVLIVIYRKGG